MRQIALVMFFLAQCWLVQPVYAQTEPLPISISAPQAGQVLQGSVSITGTTDVVDFQSAEVAFAYANDSANTWFLIQSSDQPIRQGTLATWDTTTITDGNYILRLRVTLQDGRQAETTVSGLRVRNYIPVETPTASATPAEQPTPREPTATSTPYATPTSLPPNPAALRIAEVSGSLQQGAVLAGFLFLVFAIFLGIRKKQD